jgi:hypothetical protein
MSTPPWSTAPRPSVQRAVLPACFLALVLVPAACASAPAVPATEAGEPAPTLDLGALAALDADRALCVGEAIHTQAQQTARRVGRSMNTSPGATAQRDAWFARRVEANRMQNLMRAIRVTADASPARQEWALRVLSNAIYFNPGDTRMQLASGARVGPTAHQYEDLITGGPDRRIMISQNADGFRALADAHRLALRALVDASGDATDARLDQAAARVSELMRRDPVLEVVYQEEFTLEYNYGSACGPAPLRASVAELGDG